MSRLSLLIADADEFYVESIVNFLMENYPQRFQVNSFTKQPFLLDFINNSSKKIDILLVSPEMYSDAIPKDKIKALMVLSDGRLTESVEKSHLVSKYQPGDKLVASILNVYAENNSAEKIVNNGDKKTKVIAVYSPAGGTGKTTVALSSSVQCAARGQTVFYLNVENIQSTPVYLSAGNSQNLSNIFFYVKEKNKNMALKIEAARCIDDSTEIHYFLPPDSSLELEEMLPEEMKSLIGNLTEIKQYDVIFIDLSSGLTKQNIGILEACDEIFVVLQQDLTSEVKMKQLAREFEMISKKTNIDLFGKATLILNKYKSDVFMDIENININEKCILVRLPYEPTTLTLREIQNLVGNGSEFSNGVYQLIERI